MLLAEVEAAFGQGIQVKAVGHAGVAAPAQKEGPVLVQRVAGLAVVAQGVQLARAQASAGLVQRASLVTQAKVLVLRIPHLPVVQLPVRGFTA